MLRRVKWQEHVADLEAEEQGRAVAPRINECHLVWRGTALKRLFQGFRFAEVASTEEAHHVLEPRNAVHFWDVVSRFDPQTDRGLDVM